MGLGSGITPGPLCVMVLKSAVRNGAGGSSRDGLGHRWWHGPGALFAAYLSFDAFREARISHPPELGASGASIRHALGHGVVVNALSPHPWVFWVLIGGPT